MIVLEDGPFDVFANFRGKIYGSFDFDHWVARGFNCVLCVSFWIAFLVALLISKSKREFVLNALGVAGGAVVLSEVLDN